MQSSTRDDQRGGALPADKPVSKSTSQPTIKSTSQPAVVSSGVGAFPTPLVDRAEHIIEYGRDAFGTVLDEHEKRLGPLAEDASDRATGAALDRFAKWVHDTTGVSLNYLFWGFVFAGLVVGASFVAFAVAFVVFTVKYVFWG